MPIWPKTTTPTAGVLLLLLRELQRIRQALEQQTAAITQQTTAINALRQNPQPAPTTRQKPEDSPRRFWNERLPRRAAEGAARQAQRQAAATPPASHAADADADVDPDLTEVAWPTVEELAVGYEIEQQLHRLLGRPPTPEEVNDELVRRLGEEADGRDGAESVEGIEEVEGGTEQGAEPREGQGEGRS